MEGMQNQEHNNHFTRWIVAYVEDIPLRVIHHNIPSYSSSSTCKSWSGVKQMEQCPKQCTHPYPNSIQ